MAWVQIAVAMLSGNSLRQAAHTHCASAHQAAKLVAALLRVVEWQPTVRFMTHITCRLTAKNWDQLRNPTLGNRVWATFYTCSWPTDRQTYTQATKQQAAYLHSEHALSPNNNTGSASNLKSDHTICIQYNTGNCRLLLSKRCPA